MRESVKFFAKILIFYAYILFTQYAGAAETMPTIANAGFEVIDESSKTRLAGWRTAGDGAIVNVDESVKYADKQSVRIERKDGTQFGGVLQTMDAIPWRGKVVVLQARLKVRQAGDGATGVWLRADLAKEGISSFAHSYDKLLTGDSEWVIRRALLDVPKDAKTLTYGAIISAAGTLWVDDFMLTELDLTFGKPATAAASAYLDEAIKKIRAVALNSSNVDWERAGKIASGLAADATVPAETYDAIRFLLGSLDDNHSHLILPTAAGQLTTNRSTSDFKLKSESISAMAYISIPGVAGFNDERTSAFANELNKRIGTLASEKPCGWIIDLRNNDGGNMWPMLAGLSSLLGNGVVGYFVSPKTKQAWQIKNGAALIGDAQMAALTLPTAKVGVKNVRVAVLTGAFTSSSGEAIAIAFRARANSRSFGQPTDGRSTANQTILLSDGALMSVTSSTYADRTGKLYGGKIVPDEFIAAATATTLVEDTVVAAAVKWLALSAKNNCGKAIGESIKNK
jgi:carboxyl-terminal processing protease